MVRVRVLALFAVAAALAGGLYAIASGNRAAADGENSVGRQADPGRTVLRAEGDLRWFKGNMHTHSYWSDAYDFLEMIALWYRDHGYDFLVFSDHNVLPDSERWIDVNTVRNGKVAYEKLKARFPDWIDERHTDGKHEVRLRTFAEVSEKLGEPGKFLLIQGEEITDTFQSLQVHLNVSNNSELITPRGGSSVLEVMQNNVDAAIAQRERTGRPMIVHLNHPNYTYGVTAEELMQVVGENFFEVYNGSPSVNNSGDQHHVSTDRMWDIVLTFRIAELDLPLMYGLACDDSHDYHNIPSRDADPGRGWVHVMARELEPAALIAALEAGHFYASSGVELKEIATSAEGLSVEIDTDPDVEYVVDFIGTRSKFNAASTEVVDRDGRPIRATRRYSDDIGRILKSVKIGQGDAPTASYRFQGDELYVRARITSSRLHPNPSELGEYERAWCQPVIGPAGRD